MIIDVFVDSRTGLVSDFERNLNDVIASTSFIHQLVSHYNMFSGLLNVKIFSKETETIFFCSLVQENR